MVFIAGHHRNCAITDRTDQAVGRNEITVSAGRRGFDRDRDGAGAVGG